MQSSYKPKRGLNVGQATPQSLIPHSESKKLAQKLPVFIANLIILSQTMVEVGECGWLVGCILVVDFSTVTVLHFKFRASPTLLPLVRDIKGTWTLVSSLLLVVSYRLLLPPPPSHLHSVTTLLLLRRFNILCWFSFPPQPLSISLSC